jgi:hypothetical protein
VAAFEEAVWVLQRSAQRERTQPTALDRLPAAVAAPEQGVRIGVWVGPREYSPRRNVWMASTTFALGVSTRSRRRHQIVRIGVVYLLDFKLVYSVDLIGIKPITATPNSLFGSFP